MTTAEFKQAQIILSQVERTGAKGTPPPPAPLRAQTAPKTIGKESPKEQPGPKVNTPLRWQQAGPLHTEQFPGEFAVRVTGPLPMLPALVKALDELCRLAKEQFIDPV